MYLGAVYSHSVKKAVAVLNMQSFSKPSPAVMRRQLQVVQ